MLQKYISYPARVLDTEPIWITVDLTYRMELVQIVDQKPIQMTSEREERMQLQYPYLFQSGI